MVTIFGRRGEFRKMCQGAAGAEAGAIGVAGSLRARKAGEGGSYGNEESSS